MGWRPYVRTWLQKLPRELPESGRRHLEQLFEHSIDKGLAFFRENYKQQFIPAPESSLVSCLCAILSALLTFLSRSDAFGKAGK